MSIEKAKQAALNALFKNYQESAGRLYDVSGEIREQGEDPEEIGRLLVEQGLVRDERISRGSVVCRISPAGLLEVDEMYFERQVADVLRALVEGESRQDIKEILALEDHQKAHDLVAHLEERRLIQHPQRHARGIVVELSPEGRAYYEENAGDFFE